MSAAPLSDDDLLALVHEIRAILRKAQTPSGEAEWKAAAAPTGANDPELETLLGRVSDYASACYLSKARPLPLEVAIQCAALSFPKARIDVACEAQEHSTRLVPVEMVRSIRELLDNAIKFSNGAPVKVTVNAEPGGCCSVVVADRGVGLAEDQVERVFDFLVRMHPRDDFAGFGLGLPIARRICEAAGATIRLTCNPTGGISAEIRFPQA